MANSRIFLTINIIAIQYKFIYRPFHKTLPRSSTFVNWISVSFYETGCSLSKIDFFKLAKNFLPPDFTFSYSNILNLLSKKYFKLKYKCQINCLKPLRDDTISKKNTLKRSNLFLKCILYFNHIILF